MLRLDVEKRLLPAQVADLEQQANELTRRIRADAKDIDLAALVQVMYREALPGDEVQYVRSPQIKHLVEAGFMALPE